MSEADATNASMLFRTMFYAMRAYLLGKDAEVQSPLLWLLLRLHLDRGHIANTTCKRHSADAVWDLFLPCLTVICWSYIRCHTLIIHMLSYCLQTCMRQLWKCSRYVHGHFRHPVCSGHGAFSTMYEQCFKVKRIIASACPMRRCVWRQQAVSALLLLFSLWVTGIPVLDECLCTATRPCYDCVCALWNPCCYFLVREAPTQ